MSPYEDIIPSHVEPVVQTEQNNTALAIQAAMLRAVRAAEAYKLTGMLPAYAKAASRP